MSSAFLNIAPHNVDTSSLMVRVNCNGDSPLDNQCNQLFQEGLGRGVKTHVKPNSFEKSVNLKFSVAMENIRTT